MTELPFNDYPKLEKNITVKLTKYDYDRLDSYCKLRKLKKSVVIRVLLNYWLDKENNL